MKALIIIVFALLALIHPALVVLVPGAELALLAAAGVLIVRASARWCALAPEEDPVKVRLHGTEEECRQMAVLLEQVMIVQAVSEPYPDRGRSVLVRVYVDGVPRGDR